MPWCEDCAKYMAPSAMNDDGSCPTCGRVIEDPSEATADEKTPWHFKLLVAAVVLYMVWRLVDLVS